MNWTKLPSQWKQRQRIAKIKRNYKLSVLLTNLADFRALFLVAALIYLAVLPYEGIFMGVYLDEKALVPTTASVYFDYESIETAKQRTEYLKAATGQTVYNALNGWQNSTFEYLAALGYDPLRVEFAPSSARTEHSTITVVNRAPGTDGTEALLLSAAWHCPYFTDSDLARGKGKNINGFGLLQAFAAYAKYKNFWARDLIIVFAATPSDLDLWMKAYSGSGPSSTKLYDVFSGQIQQVINIDMCGDAEFADGEVDFRSDGVNGQLSNMDMVSSASAIARNWDLPFREFGIGAAPRSVAGDAFAKYTWHAKQLWSTIQRQALTKALSDGKVQRFGHEFFPQYGIDSITIRRPAFESLDDLQWRKTGFLFEQMLRAMNNLLEYLHHSLSFYLTVEVKRFVPFSVYIGTIAALLLPLVLTALQKLRVLQKRSSATVKFIDDADDNTACVPALGRQAAEERSRELNSKALYYAPEPYTLSFIIIFHSLSFIVLGDKWSLTFILVPLTAVSAYVLKQITSDPGPFTVFRNVQMVAHSGDSIRAEFSACSVTRDALLARAEAYNLLLAACGILPLSLMNYSLALLYIVLLAILCTCSYLLKKLGRFKRLVVVTVLGAFSLYDFILKPILYELVAMSSQFDYGLETFGYVKIFFSNVFIMHLIIISL